jgi:signal transduction histidine kinase
MSPASVFFLGFGCDRLAAMSDESWTIRLSNSIQQLGSGVSSEYAVVMLGTIGLLFMLLFFNQTNRARKRANLLLKRELRSQLSKLKSVVHDYDVLIYRTSHDIRGPIASMLGLIDMALKSSSVEEVKEILTKAQDTTMALDKRMIKLMKIVYVHNLEPRIELIQIDSLIQGLFKEFKGTHADRTIRSGLTNLCAEFIYSDPNLLTLIISVLVDNSYRYYNRNISSSFVSIVLCEELTSAAEPRIIIRVTDNGVGIREESVSRLFEMFFVASENHGDGLGLFLAQRAAQRLGGSIRLRKNMNPTVFEVVLPIHRSA